MRYCRPDPGSPVHNSTYRHFHMALFLLTALFSAGVRSAHAQPADPGRTIAQWNATNATCRNANAPALEAVGACEQRDTYSKLLALMDYCYGPAEKAGPASWSACDTAKKVQDAALARTTAGFHRMRGVFVLSAGLNGNTKSYFVVDSGAANVQIPQEVADELMRNGTLGQSDFLGERRFVLADGRGVLQRVIRLRSVQVGNRTMENVLAAVSAPNSQALLGQSLLRRLNWWKIDNVKNAIELEFTGSY
jgi:clan AA aspartic protease (TIGR02281 family)